MPALKADWTRARAQLIQQHLGGDADRAGVGVALAHHDAAHGDERRGGKAKLLGTQQRGHGQVAPGAHLAVGLQRCAAAKVIRHQRLVRLRQAQLPWQPCNATCFST